MSGAGPEALGTDQTVSWWGAVPCSRSSGQAPTDWAHTNLSASGDGWGGGRGEGGL